MIMFSCMEFMQQAYFLSNVRNSVYRVGFCVNNLTFYLRCTKWDWKKSSKHYRPTHNHSPYFITSQGSTNTTSV